MADIYWIYRLERLVLDEALARAESLPILKGSYLGIEANVVGCIGELVFEKFMELHNVPIIDERNNTRHDYLVGNKMVKVEVKTKQRTVWPKIHFDNSVPLYNYEHQKPNYYAFMSLLKNKNIDKNNIYRFSHAFFVGAISAEDLKKKGVVWNSKQTDPSNNMSFWTSCLNVGMRDIISYDEFLYLL